MWREEISGPGERADQSSERGQTEVSAARELPKTFGSVLILSGGQNRLKVSHTS